jgi:hypothetical protein
MPPGVNPRYLLLRLRMGEPTGQCGCGREDEDRYSETNVMYFLFNLLRIMGHYLFRAIPVGGEIFHKRQDRPCGPPSLLYNGHRVFPGGKAARAWR